MVKINTKFSNALNTINPSSDKNLVKNLIREIVDPRTSLTTKKEAATLLLGKESLLEGSQQAGFPKNALIIIKSAYDESLIHRVVNADSDLKEAYRTVQAERAAQQEDLKKNDVLKILNDFLEQSYRRTQISDIAKDSNKCQARLETYLPNKYQTTDQKLSPFQETVKETISSIKDTTDEIMSMGLNPSASMVQNKLSSNNHRLSPNTNSENISLDNPREDSRVLLSQVIFKQSSQIASLPESDIDQKKITEAKASIKEALMDKYKVPEKHIPAAFTEKPANSSVRESSMNRKPPTLVQKIAAPIAALGLDTAAFAGGVYLGENSKPINPNELTEPAPQTRVIPLKGKEIETKFPSDLLTPEKPSAAEALGLRKTDFSSILPPPLTEDPATKFIKDSDPLKGLSIDAKEFLRQEFEKDAERRNQFNLNLLNPQIQNGQENTESKKK